MQQETNLRAVYWPDLANRYLSDEFVDKLKRDVRRDQAIRTATSHTLPCVSDHHIIFLSFISSLQRSWILLADQLFITGGVGNTISLARPTATYLARC